jgi:hypothetical protein
VKNPVERRCDLLQLEAMGDSKAHIVKSLAEKWHCSEKAVYNDFNTRSEWQPLLQSMNDARLQIINKLNYLHSYCMRKLIIEDIPENVKPQYVNAARGCLAMLALITGAGQTSMKPLDVKTSNDIEAALTKLYPKTNDLPLTVQTEAQRIETLLALKESKQ